MRLKKHPLQNRTNVEIKGGGGQRPFEQCSKKLHFSYRMASLMHNLNDKKFFSTMNQEREFDIFDTFDAYCISIIRKCALIIVYY